MARARANHGVMPRAPPTRTTTELPIQPERPRLCHPVAGRAGPAGREHAQARREPGRTVPTAVAAVHHRGLALAEQFVEHVLGEPVSGFRAVHDDQSCGDRRVLPGGVRNRPGARPHALAGVAAGDASSQRSPPVRACLITANTSGNSGTCPPPSPSSRTSPSARSRSPGSATVPVRTCAPCRRSTSTSRPAADPAPVTTNVAPVSVVAGRLGASGSGTTTGSIRFGATPCGVCPSADPGRRAVAVATAVGPPAVCPATDAGPPAVTAAVGASRAAGAAGPLGAVHVGAGTGGRAPLGVGPSGVGTAAATAVFTRVVSQSTMARTVRALTSPSSSDSSPSVARPRRVATSPATSARLMESMLRSASRSRSRSIMSTGYPVRSLSTASTAA